MGLEEELLRSSNTGRGACDVHSFQVCVSIIRDQGTKLRILHI